MRTDIGLLVFTIYSLVLALSLSLHGAFVLPILIELYRNRYDFFIIIKKIVSLNIFLLFICISVYLTNPHFAFIIFLRSNMIMIFGLLIFYNKTYFDIALGLQTLKVPDKLVSILYFSSKFILLIKNEISTFKKNLILRGFRSKTSILTYKIYANFIGLLFVNSFYKAEKLSNILITRGYHGKIYTISHTKKISNYDIFLSLVTTISLILGYTHELFYYC